MEFLRSLDPAQVPKFNSFLVDLVSAMIAFWERLLDLGSHGDLLRFDCLEPAVPAISRDAFPAAYELPVAQRQLLNVGLLLVTLSGEPGGHVLAVFNKVEEVGELRALLGDGRRPYSSL